MSGFQIPFTGLQRQYNDLRKEILDATDRVLTSGRLMDGQNTVDFEMWLAFRNSVSHAVVCHSGTQALEIIASFYKQRIEKPTILIPSLTFPASANAFIRTGWNVQFVDTDAYGIMDINKIDRSMPIQGVLGIGLYGAALPEWMHRQSSLIEDAAQHWLSGSSYRHGIASAISFDPMKNLGNYGNGGAVVTNDRELINYAQGWINNGKNTGHAEVGTNSRMSEVDCAQMMVKVRYINDWQARRRYIARQWIDAFKDSPVRCLINETNFDDHCFHKFVIEINNRNDVKDDLQRLGIETRVHYAHPLHELPAYQHYQGPDILSAASSLSRRCLSLPIYPELTQEEVEYIASSVLSCVS